MGALRVGVVGAGPWAQFVHAPMVAGHPGTELAGVWARRAGAAEELAAAHGSTAFTDVDAFLDACDAVTFAVPPDVQADLAVRAARAGKALLLEKPIALDLPAAERLADAVGEAGVGSQLVLTWRYTEGVRAFLSAAGAVGPDLVGGRGHFVSGALLGGPFATPWRLEHGVLYDLAPHVVDTLDAALGTVVGVRAHSSGQWVGLLLEHETGARSEVSLCGHAGPNVFRAGAEVYGADQAIVVDAADVVGPTTFTTVIDELLRTAAGDPHPLDVQRGLHLQRLIAQAVAER